MTIYDLVAGLVIHSSSLQGDSYSVHNTSGYLGQNLAHAQNSPSKNQSTPAPNAPQHPGDRHRHLSQVRVIMIS